MADLRTKNILVSAAALVVPAIGFTIILVASIWRGPDESESMIGFVAQTIGLMMLSGLVWFPGVVLFRRGIRSWKTNRDKDDSRLIV